MAHTEKPLADNSGKTTDDYSKLELPDTPLQRLLNQPDYQPADYKPAVAPAGELFFNSIKTNRKRAGVPFFFFGVLIPALAILLELLAGVCANMFFDPIPTIWHKLLVCLVPLANLAIWRELKNDDAEYRPRLAVASGLAIGVSAFYALLFVPLIPFALIGIIVVGLGILGLSPQLSFATSVRGAIQLRRLNRQQSAQTTQRYSFATCLVGGMLLSLGTLAALEAQTTLTRINLQRAASTDSTTSTNGVRWLRSYASQNTLLEACYWRPNRATDLFGKLLTLGNPITPAQGQTIFYRVTGQEFDSLAEPQTANGNLFFDLEDVRRSDRINGVIKNLSLSGSRIDGSIDADAALGYFEWTMVFKNETFAQQEARAQIQLPPGGVVSRLTLWVNGEPREAAFASRGKVQAAYDAVVSTRRDPVLVTSSGDDRVQVQCFPVPPNGEMKIRFGVTAPVSLESKARGWLRLPVIAERNFGVEGLNHAVWFEAKRELQSSTGALMAERPEQKLFAVRGALTDNQLSSTHQSIQVERPIETNEFNAPDPTSKTSNVIRQTIEERDWQRPQRVVLVVDASQTMQPHLTELADSIQRLPQGIELVALVSDDEVTALNGAVAEKIRRLKPVGGNDNLSALNQAWDLAAQKPDSVILWIHESKPVLLGNADDLRQRWERRPDNPQLFDLPISGGANRITEKLDGIAAVETVERAGSLAKDLDRLFARWRGESKQVLIHRQSVEGRQTAQTDSQQTSSHLARLWAFDETRRLIAAKQTDAAVKLAAAYQLVTPVSGAVVLETSEQYQRAGLEPVPPNSVPTIPEPEEWLLMFVALAVLLWMTCRRRFAWRPA